MRVNSEIASFSVPDASGDEVLPTVVTHHLDTSTNYELITIMQSNNDGTEDVVCLTRDQLAALASQAKGH